MKKLYGIGDAETKKLESILVNHGYKFQGASDVRKLYADKAGNLVMIITVYPTESWE